MCGTKLAVLRSCRPDALLKMQKRKLELIALARSVAAVAEAGFDILGGDGGEGLAERVVQRVEIAVADWTSPMIKSDLPHER